MADTVLVIYDSILFERGHTIRRWAEAVERRFVANSIQEAPQRSGELRAGIHGQVDRSGVKHLVTTIQSDAPHSLYVLKGTTGPIFSRRMYGFRNRTGLQYPRGGAFTTPSGVQRPNIPFLRQRGYALRVRAGAGFAERYAVSVSGQAANPFFSRAAAATARRHSSLRGFRPGSVGFDI